MCGQCPAPRVALEAAPALSTARGAAAGLGGAARAVPLDPGELQALGSGRGRDAAGSRARTGESCHAEAYAAALSEIRRRECASLSGLARALRHAAALGSAGAAAMGSAGATGRPILGRCAVVGSSGILNSQPQGAKIDGFDAVFRLNRAPTRGYERQVGSFTTARLINYPQSRAWATHVQAHGTLPPEVAKGEHLLLMASAARRVSSSALTPSPPIVPHHAPPSDRC